MSTELDVFVKESLAQGLERSAIREVLLRAGWREDELTNALSAYAEIDFPVPVPRPKPYLQAREAFLYLVSFLALYGTALSLLTLVFGFIDKAFPDPLSSQLFYRLRFQSKAHPAGGVLPYSTRERGWELPVLAGRIGVENGAEFVTFIAQH